MTTYTVRKNIETQLIQYVDTSWAEHSEGTRKVQETVSQKKLQGWRLDLDSILSRGNGSKQESSKESWTPTKVDNLMNSTEEADANVDIEVHCWHWS